MDKSPDAFRTISEVSEELDTPAHVLRFWESRFPQIRSVKRAGGRRYYRPADMALLTVIKHLLHDEGMTIRGVQKVLREQGVRYVAGLSGHDVPDETEDAEAALEAALAANFGPADDSQAPQDEVETAQILALESALQSAPRPREPALDGANLPPAEVVTLFDTPSLPSFAPYEPAKAEPADQSIEAPMVDLTHDAQDFDAHDFEAHDVDAPDLDPPKPAYDDAVIVSAQDMPQHALPISAPEPQSVPEADHWLDPELQQDAPSAAEANLRRAGLPLIDRLRALPPGSLANTADATV